MPIEADLLTHRILVIDDNEAIHEDYRKILSGHEDGKMSAAEAALFGEPQPASGRPTFRRRFGDAGTRRGGMRPGSARRGSSVLGRLCRHAHAARLGRARDHRTPVGTGPGNPGRRVLRVRRLRLAGAPEPARALRQAHRRQEALRADRDPAVRERPESQVAERARTEAPRREPRAGGHRPHQGTGGGEPSAAASGIARRPHRPAEPPAAG